MSGQRALCQKANSRTEKSLCKNARWGREDGGMGISRGYLVVFVSADTFSQKRKPDTAGVSCPPGALCWQQSCRADSEEMRQSVSATPRLRRLPQKPAAILPGLPGKKMITVSCRAESAAAKCDRLGIYMKQRKRTSVVSRATAVALAAILLLSSGTTALAGKTLAESTHFQEQIKLDDVLYNNNYYDDYLEKKSAEFSDVQDTRIQIDLGAYTSFEGEAPEMRTLEGREHVFYVGNENKSVTWQFKVEKDGFYQLNTTYLPVDGNGLPVSRGLKIDGEYLYDELMNIKFLRHWVDSQKPRVNSLGDEVRPSQTEIQEWTETALYDAQGEYANPLKVALKAGVHTLTMVYIDQPLALSSLSLEAPERLVPYSELARDREVRKDATRDVRFEAEDKDYIDYKTDSGITIDTSADSTLTPVGITSKKYNHIGSSSWGSGGKEIEWSFEAPESGYYQLAPRIYQGFNSGLSSTRQIKIDGKVPFEEFNEYVFTFKEEWLTRPLSDADGNPYLVYLEKGKHTISMRVVMGKMTPVIHQVTEVSSLLSNAIRNITMVTGQTPDRNYDYRLERQIPTLLGDLQKIVDLLKDCNKQISDFAIKTTPVQNNFTMCYQQIEKLIAKPSKIPAGLSNMSSSLTSIGSWLTSLKSQPLAIDYIRFAPPAEKIKNEKNTIWDTLYSVFASFILSYQKDYNAIGTLGNTDANNETIEVWVGKGKEWCEILKEMIDADFSSKYNINININILPSGALGGGTSPLLLAINAGTEPDVVLSMQASTVVEYAIRNAVYDVSKFSDFKDVKKRFLSESFVPLTYEGGVYGVPETMGFKAMFYRTDIFEQLDMKVPNTWDDVCNTLLPQLYQYNMQFSMLNDSTMMVYQAGGSYYSETGYSSRLDDPKSMKGFSNLVKMYTDYGCPVSASVLNRFRSGEMPITIGGFDTYLQFAFAAPELTGRWKMVPIPATVREDGSLNRCCGGTLGTVDAILSTTEHPEASWTFLKWFTDVDTQAAYGRQVESILGISSRWGTANIEAFKRLPWSRDELEVIEDSWQWVKEVPGVLGGYFTGRHTTNAFNRCVISGMTVRESLEQAAEDINVELRRKQKMYGVNPKGLE